MIDDAAPEGASSPEMLTRKEFLRRMAKGGLAFFTLLSIGGLSGQAARADPIDCNQNPNVDNCTIQTIEADVCDIHATDESGDVCGVSGGSEVGDECNISGAGNEFGDECAVQGASEIGDECVSDAGTEIGDQCSVSGSTEVGDMCTAEGTTETGDNCISQGAPPSEVGDQCVVTGGPTGNTEVGDRCVLVGVTEVGDQCVPIDEGGTWKEVGDVCHWHTVERRWIGDQCWTVPGGTVGDQPETPPEG